MDDPVHYVADWAVLPPPMVVPPPKPIKVKAEECVAEPIKQDK